MQAALAERVLDLYQLEDSRRQPLRGECGLGQCHLVRYLRHRIIVFDHNSLILRAFLPYASLWHYGVVTL